MKIHLNNSAFDMLMSLPKEPLIKIAAAPVDAAFDTSSTLGVFPHLRSIQLSQDPEAGTVIVPSKISGSDEYKQAIKAITEQFKSGIESSEAIEKIDDIIDSLQALKNPAAVAEGAPAPDGTPRAKRGRPKKSSAELLFERLVNSAFTPPAIPDPSSLNASSPVVAPLPGGPATPQAGGPAAPSAGPQGLQKEESDAIDASIAKLTKLRGLVVKYEQVFIDMFYDKVTDKANSGRKINDILWDVKNSPENDAIFNEIAKLVGGKAGIPGKSNPEKGLYDDLSNEALQRHIKAVAPSIEPGMAKRINSFSAKLSAIALGKRGPVDAAGNKSTDKAALAKSKVELMGERLRSLMNPSSDIAALFRAAYNKMSDQEKATYKPLYDRIQAVKVPAATPAAGAPAASPAAAIAPADAQQARQILLDQNLAKLQTEFGPSAGELMIEEQLDIKGIIGKVADEIANYIESTGPAKAASYSTSTETIEAHLNNKGQMIVNGEALQQDFVDTVRDLLRTLLRNLGIAPSADVAKILSVNPMTNPRAAVYYMLCDDFIAKYNADNYNAMTFNQVSAELNSNYPEVLSLLFQNIIRVGQKYKIELAAIDKPIQVEPGGSIYLRTHKGIRDYVFFKFLPASRTPYTISYSELLSFMNLRKSEIDRMLQANQVNEAAQMLYKGAMKFEYVRELASATGNVTDVDSKFSSSQFFGEISSSVTDQEIRSAKIVLRMTRLAAIGAIKTPDEFESQKKVRDQVKTKLEELKKDPDKNSAMISTWQTKLDTLEKQIGDYELTQSEGANFGGKVGKPLEGEERPEPVDQSQLPQYKIGVSDEEIIDHELGAIQDLLTKQVDVFKRDPHELRKFQLDLEDAEETLEAILKKYDEKLSMTQKQNIALQQKQITTKLNVVEPIMEQVMTEVNAQDAEAEQNAEAVMEELEESIKSRDKDMAKAIELLEYSSNKKENIKRARKNIKSHKRIEAFMKDPANGFVEFLEELDKAEALAARSGADLPV